jgi:hypothetical protein
MAELTQALFQSRTRAALLRLTLVEVVADSMSGLARRANLSAHAVAVEVKNLANAGLLELESVGASDLVRANTRHPAAKPLAELLRVAAKPPPSPRDQEAKETLVACGAPLLAYQGKRHMALEAALVEGLRAAKRDATLLKVLPVVVAKNAAQLDWAVLKENAKRAKLKAELGMLVEMTADFANKPDLKEKVQELRDRRRKVASFFSHAPNKYERELAKTATPRAARRWYFLMNLSEDSFRSTLVKHLG